MVTRIRACNREYPAVLTDPLDGRDYKVTRICGLPVGHNGPCLSRYADGWRQRMRDIHW